MTKSIKVTGELTIIWLKAQVPKVERISYGSILKTARLRCLYWLDFCLISLAHDDFSGLVTCFGVCPHGIVLRVYDRF
jgi:hypothetical protein